MGGFNFQKFAKVHDVASNGGLGPGSGASSWCTNWLPGSGDQMKWPKSDEFSWGLIQYNTGESKLSDSEEKWPPEAAAEQNFGDRLTSSPTSLASFLASLQLLFAH